MPNREAKSYYHNGVVTDTVWCWYPSGHVKRHVVEIDTVKKIWHNLDYFENSSEKVDCYQYQDSVGNFVLDGLFKEWYENGQLKLMATLKNGTALGKWKEYDSSSKTMKESDEPLSITP